MSLDNARIAIEETVENAEYKSGEVLPAYIARVAICSSTGTVNLADLKRVHRQGEWKDVVLNTSKWRYTTSNLFPISQGGVPGKIQYRWNMGNLEFLGGWIEHLGDTTSHEARALFRLQADDMDKLYELYKQNPFQVSRNVLRFGWLAETTGYGNFIHLRRFNSGFSGGRIWYKDVTQSDLMFALTQTNVGQAGIIHTISGTFYL
jgi:hypothetical protein